MASFWGVELSSSKPCTYEPNGPEELQVTGVAIAKSKPNAKVLIQVSADGGPKMTVCTLEAEKRPQEKLDLLFGSGNSKIVITASGSDAIVHMSGYKSLTESFNFGEDDEEGEDDEDEDDEDDDEEEGMMAMPASSKPVKRSAAAASGAPAKKAKMPQPVDDEDEDDEDEDDEGMMDDDEGEEEDDEGDLGDDGIEDDDDDDDDGSEDQDEDDDFGVRNGGDDDDDDEELVVRGQAVKAGKAGKAAAPAAKPAKAAKAAAAPPPASGGGSDEATFEAAIVATIKADGGKVALSKLGNSVKKPAGLKTKLGAFIKANPKVFKVVGADVTLA